jgi:gamma-glutamyl:cysteine ligase YbdK (ATP-grasp superfamily)
LEQKISSTQLKEFKKRLEEETKILKDWFNTKAFCDKEGFIGIELEACILDKNYDPLSIADKMIDSINNPLIVPEVGNHNFEINSNVFHLQENGLENLHTEIQKTIDNCKLHLPKDSHIIMCGILPTLKQDDIINNNMSKSSRFSMLNNRINDLRQNIPAKLDISGRDRLSIEHQTIMLESVTTSFQIHLQVSQNSSVDYYNYSRALSPVIVAIGANSPYMFAKELWDETRAPVFDSAVSLNDGKSRVYLGTKYMSETIFEYFEHNVLHHEVLLAKLYDSKPEELKHLSLHNGTIWRWNRPIIGLNKKKPTIRIEHRTLPAGPTVIDQIANGAFFYGLLKGIVERKDEFSLIPFQRLLDDFNNACKFSLEAKILWFDGDEYSIDELILTKLLPIAKEGLEQFLVPKESIYKYLKIIEDRASNKQTGANWQKRFCKQNGVDMRLLTKEYIKNQNSGKPVSSWSI